MKNFNLTIVALLLGANIAFALYECNESALNQCTEATVCGYGSDGLLIIDQYDNLCQACQDEEVFYYEEGQCSCPDILITQQQEQKVESSEQEYYEAESEQQNEQSNGWSQYQPEGEQEQEIQQEQEEQVQQEEQTEQVQEGEQQQEQEEQVVQEEQTEQVQEGEQQQEQGEQVEQEEQTEQEEQSEQEEEQLQSQIQQQVEAQLQAVQQTVNQAIGFIFPIEPASQIQTDPIPEIYCCPFPRPLDCINQEELNVCGIKQGCTDNCQQTYLNACEACLNRQILYYQDGVC